MLVDQERLSNEYSMKLLDQLYASDQADRVELAESRIVQYVPSSCNAECGADCPTGGVMKRSRHFFICRGNCHKRTSKQRSA